MAAGNRNRNIFVNIMDSMAKSTELYNEALNSSGTMMEIQNKYMDTFEGKLGTLQASFESLFSSFWFSYNFFVDLLIASIRLFDIWVY